MSHKMTTTILFFVISWIGMYSQTGLDNICNNVSQPHSNNFSFIPINCHNIGIVKNAAKRVNKTSNIIIDCKLKLEYNPEGEAWRCRDIQLILNDTLSLFRSQTLFEVINNDAYTQVSLNEQTSTCLRFLLYELYTKHNSIIKDHYINNDSLMMLYSSKIWQIKINLNGKNIKESHNLLNYTFSFDMPFNPQADKILELILAIKRKMEKDIYKFNDIDYYPQKWIMEMFHDEYYEPYNDIKSINYQ